MVKARRSLLFADLRHRHRRCRGSASSLFPSGEAAHRMQRQGKSERYSEERGAGERSLPDVHRAHCRLVVDAASAIAAIVRGIIQAERRMYANSASSMPMETTWKGAHSHVSPTALKTVTGT